MQSKTSFSPGRAGLILFFCCLLAACSSSSVTLVPTLYIPTSTPAPTWTTVPTVTPIPPRAIPDTGQVPTMPGLPPLDPGAAAADPLDPTLTAQAGPVQPTAAPQDAASAAPADEPIPTGKLLSTYLGLIPSSQGLWAMRQNGTDMTLLTSDPIYAMDVSPGGSMVAYITHSNPGSIYEQPYGYTLKVVTLRNDQFFDVANIGPPGLSAQSDPAALDAAAQGLAAYKYGGLSWSPDGRRLAFTSSHEAAPGQPASSDVYIYAPAAGTIQRLSTFNLPNGPAHAYSLRWSPEGQRLYYAAAYSFGAPGSGSRGIWMGGSWVSWLTGSLVQVSDGSQPGPDNLITWPSWSEVLIDTSNPVCGSSDLRMINLRTGEAKSLWPGCFADIIYVKGRGEVIVSVTPDQANPDTNNLPGIYAVPMYYGTKIQNIANTGFKRLYDGDYRAAWYGWNPGEGLFAIQRSGAITPTFSGPPYDGSTGVPLRPLRRLNTGEWLWTSDSGGLYKASPGKEPQPLLNQNPQNLSGSPTVPGLYFFFNQEDSGPVLYGVRSRDWEPFVVETRIKEVSGIVWVP